MVSQSPRTLEEIRALIGSMPFAAAAGIEIEDAAPGYGVASLPLSDVVAFTAEAFAGTAVGLVGDLAAGAAVLAEIPADRKPMTVGVDTQVTASTTGRRLRARARIRERRGNALILDADVIAEGPGFEPRLCGTVVATIVVGRLAGP